MHACMHADNLFKDLLRPAPQIINKQNEPARYVCLSKVAIVHIVYMIISNS